MALTVPAVPPNPPDALLLSSGKPIRAGSSTDRGRVYDIIQANNLILAAGHAQHVFCEAWADGQASFAGAGWNERCRWIIPYLSARHLTLHFVVLAKDTAGVPKIRMSSVNAGLNTDTNIAGGAWTLYEGSITLTKAGFGPHGGEYYEEIAMSTDGSVDVRIAAAWYEEATAGATYPAADTLTSGPFEDGNLATSVPLDDALAVADGALPSWLAHRLRTNLVNASARQRVYVSTSALEGVALAAGGEYIPWYPHRYAIPIPLLAADQDFEITVWARIENDALTDWSMFFERGDGAREALWGGGGPSVTTITAPATTGVAWYKTTITVRPSRLRAPLQYGGIAHIGFEQSAPVTGTSGLKSLAVWAVA